MQRAPKQWCLGREENINSFENWKQNLIYTLSLDANFAPYLQAGVEWGKKTRTAPHRGFLDDGDDVPAATRRTRDQKVSMLELMLGQVANFCPVIARSAIVKNSTSIEQVWQTIRSHYGFQSTGGHFVDFNEIQLEPEERPEDLYQRLMAFIEDNLLQRNGGLTHHGDQITEDEEISPSTENLVVLTWLRLIHKDLPKLVKQRYGTELRTRTLASIKPEISQALTSLLEEVHATQEIKAMRTQASRTFRPRTSNFTRSSQQRKICPLCKQAGRPYQHYLSVCTHLPDSDRKYMTKARQIIGAYDDPVCDTETGNHADHISSEDQTTNFAHVSNDEHTVSDSSTLRVAVRQSPYMDLFCEHLPARLTVDSGATGNFMRASVAKHLAADIKKSTQSAHQADGSSPLKVTGETKVTFTRDKHNFVFEGLVVENLDVDILAGIPFMEANDVHIRPAKHQVLVGDHTVYHYGASNEATTHHTVRRAHVIRAPPDDTTVWPGHYIEITLPDELATSDTIYALEPRTDFVKSRQIKVTELWPQPDLVSSIGGKLRIPNLTKEPQVLKRHQHFCQVLPAYIPQTPNNEGNINLGNSQSTMKGSKKYHEAVSVDPDNILQPHVKSSFHKLLETYSEVFNPNFKSYNGAAGPFKARVNMGPVQPPQRKGRVPQYSRDKLLELQQKFDELESLGVFSRPEDIGIDVEYINPSFLVKKTNGGYRLVTAFADVGRYSKPQPSLMPDINSTLRHIAQWKYLIATDLTQAFYQIPLSPESMKYCGVATPYRGVRVYVRTAMGMPGSETALEELMCRVLGELLKEGTVARIADDLYCGGNTPAELLYNWEQVLSALQRCDLTLSATKTVIAPKSTTILGWKWSQGTLSASPHRLSALSTCARPDSVYGLRSFIGAFKVLARVIPRCATLLAPLDDIVAGRASKDKIEWTDYSCEAFQKAQESLSSSRTITLPRPDDQLWIITDGAVRKPGIGATFYVMRNNTLHVAGFFSAKLRGRQVSWIPCEIEALAIAVAVKHFSPYIVQSKHNTCILTDSRPCVQAFQKLCRGDFSASPRVTTFLSAISRYQAVVQHIAGARILPTDFASRNSPECSDVSCQVCSFIRETEESVVCQVSTSDILDGKIKPPFTSRPAWTAIQSECADLRRTRAHLIQGTRPSKKLTNIKDVKRYLNVATIAPDGLLVVKRPAPLAPSRECIVIPRQVLDGLLTSLHIRLDHPSCHQLKVVCERYFFALDLGKAVEKVSASCHQCASLRKVPHTKMEQSSMDPPDAIGVSFAADVIKRAQQLILVLRECTTSYTMATLVENERRDSLREALLRTAIEFVPLDGPKVVIRTDSAPGFVALVNDQLLHKHGINIELGRVKNQNKNPIAERAVQELEQEILRQDPLCKTVSPLTLSLATARMNTRIRSTGLSAREMWTQRDQSTNSQIPLSDQKIILHKHEQHLYNHPFSEKSKAPSGKYSIPADIHVGDLVYLYRDRDKSRARDRYLVVSIDGTWCNIQKFIGNQLRSTSYRVKRTECYKVPSHIFVNAHMPQQHETSSSEEELINKESVPHQPSPPPAPEIPLEFSATPSVQAPDLDYPLLHIDNDQEQLLHLPHEPPTEGPRRSTRIKRKPQRYGDFV